MAIIPLIGVDRRGRHVAVVRVTSVVPWSRARLDAPRTRPAATARRLHPGRHRPSRSASPAAIARRRPQNARQAALGGLAASFGAAAALTAAQARLGGRRAVDGDGQDDLDAGPAAALVDRLEALAHLREQGLLEEREYDAAKAAVLRDLDALA